MTILNIPDTNKKGKTGALFQRMHSIRSNSSNNMLIKQRLCNNILLLTAIYASRRGILRTGSYAQKDQAFSTKILKIFWLYLVMKTRSFCEGQNLEHRALVPLGETYPALSRASLFINGNDLGSLKASIPK